MLRRVAARLQGSYVPLTRDRHLRVLGLPTDSGAPSADEVKLAYRTKAKRLHPDVPGTGDAAQFKAVQEAYHVLSGRSVDFDLSSASGRSTAATRDASAGAQWARGGTYYQQRGNANDQEYANASTANFYRPTHNASDPFGGFTADEVSEWRSRKRLFHMFRLLKALLIFTAMYSAVKIFTETKERQRRGVDIANNLYTAEYWHRVAEDERAGVMPTVVNGKSGTMWQHQQEASRAAAEQRDALKSMPVGLPKIKASTVQHHNATFAVSFRGQPFTADGLAALQERRRRKGGPNALAAAADDDCMDEDVTVE